MSKDGRLKILKEMFEAISKSNLELSKYTPKNGENSSR